MSERERIEQIVYDDEHEADFNEIYNKMEANDESAAAQFHSLQTWLTSLRNSVATKDRSELLAQPVSDDLEKTQGKSSVKDEMLVIERDLLPAAKEELYRLTSPDYKAKDNPRHEHRAWDVDGLLGTISWLETRYLIALEAIIPF